MSDNRFFRNILAAALFGALVIPRPSPGQNAAASVLPGKSFTFQAKNSNIQTVVSELAKQTGVEIDISGTNGATPIDANFNKTAFWNVVEALASQSRSRVVIGQRGKAVRLVKNAALQAPASVDGPFRIAARSVESRIDLQTGKRLYDLNLEVAWEPQLPIYRVDAHPVIVKGHDDAGRLVTVKPFDGRNPVDGVSTQLRIPLEGLSRESKTLARLQGVLRVTAAEEMLQFQFDNLARPAVVKQKGVEVALRKFVKEGTFWIADLELHYPKESALFESFETYWVSRNRMTLIAPNGAARFVSSEDEVNGAALRYRFKEDPRKGFDPKDLAGWKMVYEAPGVMSEIPVKFDLKGIALP